LSSQPPQQSSNSDNNNLGKLNRKPLFLLAISAVIVIIFTIVLTATYQTQLILSEKPEKPFSKIITFGPLWENTIWSCTSDRDFIVHGALRGLQGSQITINISDLGTQSLYSLDPERMESFSVGSPAGHTMIITRTGTVSGWITLQTVSDATANCTQS
jgi:hypothetical protein